MVNYPETTEEFEDYFATEATCYAYLYKIRWPHGFRCPKCEHNTAWVTKKFLFYCKTCNHATSLKAGTLFQDIRKPLHIWFRAIWYLVTQEQGVSARCRPRELGFSRYETAWIWLHKLRSIMILPEYDKLSGTVQVDELYIDDNQVCTRGRGTAGKTLVVIAVEDRGRQGGRFRILHVPEASPASLEFAVQKMIRPRSIVQTDGWEGYANLRSMGYIHKAVQPSGVVGQNPLPLVRQVAISLKQWFDGSHKEAVCQSHLDFYLDEFCFQFNHRTKSRGQRFLLLMQRAVQVGPLVGDRIRGGKTETDNNI